MAIEDKEEQEEENDEEQKSEQHEDDPEINTQDPVGTETESEDSDGDEPAEWDINMTEEEIENQNLCEEVLEYLQEEQQDEDITEVLLLNFLLKHRCNKV
jgi:hypothetical protein